MDLDLDEGRVERLRHATDWLDANVPREPLAPMDTARGAEQHRAWERRLAEDRWGVVHWPEKYGGRGYDLLDWLLFEEAYHALGAPARINHNGITLLGSTLLEHGTSEQRERLLPALVRGETVWAQAWSEPEAGSDLASVRCRARRVDGGYLLSGQKIWSSRAVVADRAFGLFRSDPDSARHRGLTYLMFDLHGDSVEVRPIRRFDGEPVFAEIFLDECFVPDVDVIGTPGEGWSVVMSTAATERGVSLRSPGRFLATAGRLVELWRRLPQDVQPEYAARVRGGWMRAQAYRMAGFLTAEGRLGVEESSTGKLFWSGLDIDLHETALDIVDRLRLDGVDHDHLVGLDLDQVEMEWLSGYRFALAGPIYAGTNQIQMNIIAERLLGLARQ